MGAEGARITYPYLSGQRTEKASVGVLLAFCNQTRVCICSGIFIYLSNMREIYL